MKLHNEKEIQMFVDAINCCERSVFMTTPTSKHLDLKKLKDLYMGISLLLSHDGNLIEIFPSCREDEAVLLRLLVEMDQIRTAGCVIA